MDGFPRDYRFNLGKSVEFFQRDRYDSPDVSRRSACQNGDFATYG
jgi:hypothetical protein